MLKNLCNHDFPVLVIFVVIGIMVLSSSVEVLLSTGLRKDNKIFRILISLISPIFLLLVKRTSFIPSTRNRTQSVPHKQ